MCVRDGNQSCKAHGGSCPNQSEHFHLDTDASNSSIVAVVSRLQNCQEKVIAYGSHTLTKTKRNHLVTSMGVSPSGNVLILG